MKSKPKPRTRKRVQLPSMIRVVNPRYITFTTPYDPLIARYIKQIMGLSS
jgi:hypothetical protein